MLTNGWRKFRWEQLRKNSFVKDKLPYPLENDFLSLSATVQPDKGAAGMLKKSNSVSLFFEGKDSSRSVNIAPLNDNSWFVMPNLLLFDTTKVYYQLNNAPLKGLTRVEAQISGLPYQPEKILSGIPAPSVIALLSADERIEQATRSFGKMTLEEVKVRSRIVKKTREEELNDRYTGGLFKGGNAVILNMVDNDATKMTGNIFSYLQAKVAGLQVIYDGGKVNLDWQGSGTNSIGAASRRGTFFQAAPPGPSPSLMSSPIPGGGTSVAVLLNEVLVAPERLLDFNIADIAMVKVFRPPFMGVPMGNGGIGAIAVYTKKGADASAADIKSMDAFTISAYTPIRDFYSPDYAIPDPSFVKPDYRKTLLWKPDIFITEGELTRSIRFYNNDAAERIRIILQGVTADGKLVHISRWLQ
jgi:hypothetical protein